MFHGGNRMPILKTKPGPRPRLQASQARNSAELAKLRLALTLLVLVAAAFLNAVTAKALLNDVDRRFFEWKD